MTLCCRDGSGTCMRRAPPMAGCATSPSPPISFEVSTMTTLQKLEVGPREEKEEKRLCNPHLTNQINRGLAAARGS